MTIPTTIDLVLQDVTSRCYQVDRPADGRITAEVVGAGNWTVCIGHLMCVKCFDDGLRTGSTTALSIGQYYFVKVETPSPGVSATLRIYPTATGMDGRGAVGNLTGTCTYDGPNGKASVVQEGAQVSMQMTNSRRAAAGPHYVLDGTLAGRVITGTWRFVVSPLVGQDSRFAAANCKGGAFNAEVSADGKSIRFYNVEDPCNHSLSGAVIMR